MRILISVPSALTPSSANLLPHQRTVNITFVSIASLNGLRWVYPDAFFKVENIRLCLILLTYHDAGMQNYRCQRKVAYFLFLFSA